MPIQKQHGQSDADEGENQKIDKWAAASSYDVV